MDQDSHTVRMSKIFRDSAEQYLEENQDADINDFLTALSMMLVMHCIINDIPRTEVLRNVSMTYDTMWATKDYAVRALN